MIGRGESHRPNTRLCGVQEKVCLELGIVLGIRLEGDDLLSLAERDAAVITNVGADVDDYVDLRDDLLDEYAFVQGRDNFKF